MRVASLVPVGSETLVELGCAQRLVGRSHECKGVDHARVVTRGKFDTEGMSCEEVGIVNRASTREDVLLGSEGGSLAESLVTLRLCSYFWTDVGALLEAAPDVVITVIDEGEMAGFDEVQSALRSILRNDSVKVVVCDPKSIDEVWQTTSLIGRSVGLADGVVRDYVQTCRARFESAISPLVAAREGTPTVAVVQWTDPLYLGGSWTPEIVAAAGGSCVVCKAGEGSKPVTWQVLKRLDPQVVIFTLCGLDLAESSSEVERLARTASEFVSLSAYKRGRVYAVNARWLFTQPSARCMVESRDVVREILGDDRTQFRRPVSDQASRGSSLEDLHPFDERDSRRKVGVEMTPARDESAR